MSTTRRSFLARIARLAALGLLGLAGCGNFAAYQRADAARNAVCVDLCEQVLSRPSLAMSDDRGACACYAPSEGWDSSPGVLVARIQSERPVHLASLAATAR